MVSETLVVKNHIGEVGRVNEALREFWVGHGLPRNFEVPVTLCLEEVLSNVIRHGCEPGREYDIQVSYRVAGSGIEVDVIDSARPFDPLTLPPPNLDLPLERRKAGGLGVFMVRQMMDNVRYEYCGGRNCFHFEKHWA